jgi:O-antigen/teichoic acid export membrane protein
MLPIMTQHLTPEDYGSIGIIMAYLTAFEALQDLGLRMILTSSFFKYPSRFMWLWRKIFGVIQIWSVFFSFFLGVVFYFILPRASLQHYDLIVLTVIFPVALCDTTLLVGRQFLQLSKKPITLSLISVMSGIVVIIVNYISVVLLNKGFQGLLLGIFASSLFSLLCYSYIVFLKYKIWPDFKFSLRWLRKKLGISLPSIPHYFAGFLLNISDRVILSVLGISIGEIGIYSFAYNLGFYFSVLGKGFSQAVSPYLMEGNRLCSYAADNKSKLLCSFYQVSFLALALLLSIWSREFYVLFVINKDLKSAYVITILVFFSYTYFPSYAFLSMKIWYLEKTKYLSAITFGSGVLSVILNLFLIPFFGILGAAWSTFVSFMFMGYFGYLIKVLKPYFYVSYNWKQFLLITIFSLIFSLFIVESNIEFKVFITLVIIIFATYFIRKKRKLFVHM